MAINYDMPESVEKGADPEAKEALASSADTYLHRVGRAGRFGTKGVAISFVTNDRDKKVIAEIESRFGKAIDDYPEDGKVDVKGGDQ